MRVLPAGMPKLIFYQSAMVNCIEIVECPFSMLRMALLDVVDSKAFPRWRLEADRVSSLHGRRLPFATGPAPARQRGEGLRLNFRGGIRRAKELPAATLRRRPSRSGARNSATAETRPTAAPGSSGSTVNERTPPTQDSVLSNCRREDGCLCRRFRHPGWSLGGRSCTLRLTCASS